MRDAVPPSGAPSWWSRPAARFAGAVVLALAIVFMGAAAVHKQVRDGNDLPIYWQAARDLLAGRSPYEIGTGLHGFVYLPWFALVLVPLAALPLPVAAAAWYVANLIFLVYAVRELRSAITTVAPVPSHAWLLAASLPLAGLVHDNLMLGQANLLLLLLVAVTARTALGPRPRFTTGIPLALAAMLKMPAAMLLLPLALRARGRTFAGFAAGVTLALALPLLVTGATSGARLLRDWRAKVVAPAAAGELQGSRTIDQSPHAALRRLLVAEPAFAGRAVNVAALDRAGFSRVSRGVTLGLFAGYLLVWLLAPMRGEPRALALDLALATCAMVQVVGFNLKAQFVVLLLPAWLAVSLALEHPARPPRVLLALAAACFLLSQPGLVGRTVSNWLLAASAMTIGTLLLSLAIAIQRYAIRPSPSAAPAGARAAGTPR